LERKRKKNKTTVCRQSLQKVRYVMTGRSKQSTSAVVFTEARTARMYCTKYLPPYSQRYIHRPIRHATAWLQTWLCAVLTQMFSYLICFYILFNRSIIRILNPRGRVYRSDHRRAKLVLACRRLVCSNVDNYLFQLPSGDTRRKLGSNPASLSLSADLE